MNNTEKTVRNEAETTKFKFTSAHDILNFCNQANITTTQVSQYGVRFVS